MTAEDERHEFMTLLAAARETYVGLLAASLNLDELRLGQELGLNAGKLPHAKAAVTRTSRAYTDAVVALERFFTGLDPEAMSLYRQYLSLITLSAGDRAAQAYYRALPTGPIVQERLTGHEQVIARRTGSLHETSRRLATLLDPAALVVSEAAPGA